MLALGLVSGGLAVAYEVLWSRELLNLLGSSTRASAGILAAFMLGISLGSWLAGRWSAQISGPLRLYAVAEGALLVFGFAFPEVLGRLSAMVSDAALWFGVFVALLLVPTFLMGMALPLLAAALQGYGADRPRHIAWLYGLNTFGGAIAALGVGFVALPTFGLEASQRDFDGGGLASDVVTEVGHFAPARNCRSVEQVEDVAAFAGLVVQGRSCSRWEIGGKGFSENTGASV